MASCLAYYLTWSTYGVRLHGDPRGTVDLFHNTPGEPLLATNDVRVELMRKKMNDAPFVLNECARVIVKQAITDHAHKRGWLIRALNVRTNHVHVVIDVRTDHTPEDVMQQFKSWGTRYLIREQLATNTTRVWTDHGSTRYVNTSESLAKAIDYVVNQQ